MISDTGKKIKRIFKSSKVRLSGLRPEPFQQNWPYCLPGFNTSLYIIIHEAL